MLGALREAYGLDKRSLALFRLALGFVLLGDLLQRLLTLPTFLTDDGLYPRALVLNNEWSSPYVVNVWLAAGGSFGACLLTGATLASAACFMAGYWTKLSGWLTWLSIMGLHYRNPLVLHAGDVLVRCALFFANFLPLADHLSVDAGVKTWQLLQRRKCDAAFQQREKAASVHADAGAHLWLSTASLAYQLQVCCVYFFGALLKSDPEWVTLNTATWYALQQKFFSTAVGSALARFPLLLSLTTVLVVRWEFWAPLLVWLPFQRVRLGFVVSAALMHIGFGLSLRLELLLWAPLVALIPLIPSSAWAWWSQRYGKSRRSPLVLHVDLERWLSTRVLFFFHTFLLHDATIAWAHLDGAPAAVDDFARSQEWLVVTCLPKGNKLVGAAAVEELCLQSNVPLVWIFANLVNRCARLVDAVGESFVGRAVDEDPLLRYKRAPRVQVSSLPGAGDDRQTASTHQLQHQQPLRRASLLLTARWWKRALLATVVVLAALFVVRHNLYAVGAAAHYGPRWNFVGAVFGLHQRWDMFAPSPPHHYWWYRVVGRLLANPEARVSMADMGLLRLNARPVAAAQSEPASLWTHYGGSHRQFKFFEVGYNRDVPGVREQYARYMCTNWNARYTKGNGMELVGMEVTLMTQSVDADSPSGALKPPSSIVLWSGDCPPERAAFVSAPIVKPSAAPTTQSQAAVAAVAAAVAGGGAIVSPLNHYTPRTPDSVVVGTPPPPVAAVGVRPGEQIDRVAPWANVITGDGGLPPPPSASTLLAGLQPAQLDQLRQLQHPLRNSGVAASSAPPLAPQLGSPQAASAAGGGLHSLALAWAALNKQTSESTTTAAALSSINPAGGPVVLGKWVRGQWVPNRRPE